MCLLRDTDLGRSTKVSILPDNLPSTEAPLSQSETKILHPASSSLKSRPLRRGAVHQSQEGGRRENILQLPWPKPKSHISNNGCSRWKSGKVVRGPARHSSSSSGMKGPLWTLKLEILGLQRIINYIFHCTDIHLIQGSGL